MDDIDKYISIWIWDEDIHKYKIDQMIKLKELKQFIEEEVIKESE